MFRIVIADDEKYIVQLIEALIDCKRLGAEIVGKARDGMEALNLVEQLTPDILITDIRMPSMDGLELIDQIRLRGFSTAVIAISGHRRFDYAISAIKYGVDDFIVKPINERDLNDALEKVCARLRGEQHVRDLSERVEEHASVLRGNFVRDMIRGALTADISLPALNQQYGVTLSEDTEYTAMAIALDMPDSSVALKPILARCERTAQEMIKTETKTVLCAQYDAMLLCVLQTRGVQIPDLLGDIKKLFEQLIIVLEAYNPISLSIGVGTTVKTPNDVQSSAELAQLCAKVKCIRGTRRIYHSAQLDIWHMDAKISPNAVRELNALMERHDVQSVQSWLDGVFSLGEAYYRENPIEALAIGHCVIKKFKGLCEGLNIITGEMTAKPFANVELAQDYTHFKNAIALAVETILTADYVTRTEREAFPIVRAKAFMMEHLCEPIKLEDIATEVSLSPSYFSALFKKESGETISDYLQRIRLEEAKKLLRATSLNLNEIAQRVGYTDAKHFSKMFRKQTGARPNEYRKLYAW